MATEFRYHHHVYDVLGQTPATSPVRYNQLRAIQARLKIRLPAAIVEWFALEEAETLFSDHTTPDYLFDIEELAALEWIQRGYVPIAYENQGVVTWYARLDGSDDPPIYDDHDGDETENWHYCSATLSNFLHHMIAIGSLDQQPGQLVLIADDQRPDSVWLHDIVTWMTATPRSERLQRARYGFFNHHGRISIRSTLDAETSKWNTRWAFEAPTPEDLAQLLRHALPYGTLATTLHEGSTDPALRALETHVLSHLRTALDRRPGA